MQPGERVAIWSPNTHHWVVGALGVLYAGATLVPVSTRFTGHEALDVISRSGARGLIVAGPFLGSDRLTALRAAIVAASDPGAAGKLILEATRLDPKDLVMLTLTFVVGSITLGTGRTNIMQGAVHLVIFAAWLFLSLFP